MRSKQNIAADFINQQPAACNGGIVAHASGGQSADQRHTGATRKVQVHVVVSFIVDFFVSC